MLFKLRSPHIIEGAQRNAGTIVGPLGSGAPVVFVGEPTPDMEGVDPEGVEVVNKVHQRMYGRDAPWHIEGVAVPERPYHDEHPDYAEVSEEDQKKAEQAMVEANADYHNRAGTAPLETLPHPMAGGTHVAPMPEAPPAVGEPAPAPAPPVRPTPPARRSAKDEEEC